MNGDLPTSIRLDADLREYLMRHAERQGCSLTWLIRDVLRRWVEDRRKDEQHAA
jgi:predicted transcriptional regulator